MRTFKAGDKVKFLDQEGGGVITKVISPSLVNVEVDGFEIPTLTKEIVLDFVEDKAGKMFTSAGQFTDDEPAVYDEEKDLNFSDDEDDIRQERLYLSRKGQEKEKGVYLAFVPCDQKWLIGGEYFVYLVNNSDYTLLYSLFLKDEQQDCFIGEDYGSVDEKSRFLLATIEDKQLEKWTGGVIQLLLHKDKSRNVLMPASYQIKIKTSKFFKEGCFEETGLFAEKALIVPIVSVNTQDIAADYEKTLPQRQAEAKKLQEMKAESVAVEVKQPKPQSFFDKHLVNHREAEVDLHIEELVDTEKGLENADKLNIQLDYFRRCLDKAVELNLDKIVFIHGVGQGILKHNIEEELDKYSFIHYFPASMQKYGVGATEVIIGKNKR
ncbi:MAG: DUF2027 domain-containing protein [Bacteroidales bacterium]|nr:DUF2027 domain-containing protein [Bacteroidales bacterium]